MSRQTRLAAFIACGALMLGTTSCGSDDGPSANPEGASVTTAAPAGTSDGGTEPADAASGSGTATLVDGPAAADKTVTLTAAGAYEPSTLEVGVGEEFTFQAAPDAGTHAVSINGADAATISGGLTETFTIDAPGTYQATDELSDATATITVTG